MANLSIVTPGQTTLRELGLRQLRALSSALGLETIEAEVLEAFEIMTDSWGANGLGAAKWPSDVCDDHSPFELSVTFDGRQPELRMLVEALPKNATVSGQREAGIALTQRLSERYPLALERYRAVADVLLPTRPQGLFSLWHALCFSPAKPPLLKVYFNLQARGPGKAPAMCEEALNRIGFEAAWPAVARALALREPGEDELVFFSLDMLRSADARVKVYFRHPDADGELLEELFSQSPTHRAGDVARLCQRLAGPGPYTRRALVSCFTFQAPSCQRPSEATLYFPVGSYARSDAETQRRVAPLLSEVDSSGSYAACLRAMTERSLDEGVGLQSYLSFRRALKGTKMTVYLCPEAYEVRQPLHSGSGRYRTRLRRPVDVVRRHEKQPITDHPYFTRLTREPVQLDRLWLLLANFKWGIVDEFPRRLYSLTARCDVPQVTAILASQLLDERGAGQSERAHKLLFARMLDAISAAVGLQPTDALVAPGKELGRELEHCYVEAPFFYGLGASLLVEVFGKQVDSILASELRSQSAVAKHDLDWVFLHEELEEIHANESYALADMIPEGEATELALAGARAIHAASVRFFDRMYVDTFVS